MQKKAVTSQKLGDQMWRQGSVWVDLKPSSATTSEDESSGVQDLLDYLSSLHRNELKLWDVILRQLSYIPIPILATAADERLGSLESLDDSDFEDTSTH